MIRVSNLSRRFGGLLALDRVGFEVARGEVVGFLGPNGAGKTTALRILAGYLPASSGSASVAGFDVLAQSLEVRRRIGYMPESVPLYREHRVVEMLEFHARLHRMPRALRRRRIPEVLDLVGVRDRSRDLIGKLSRGLRQRVALALALLPDPEVLILDEPTSGLDPLQRIEVRRLLRDLADRRTVLLSSHILPEIEAACPRVIVIHQGRIVGDGTPADLVLKLGGESTLRLEAVVGQDLEKALRMLRSIPGASEVMHRGRLGIHDTFEIRGEVDLREDVGAVAAQRGWALRELSSHRPTLEQIFTSLTLGLDPREAAGRTDVPASPVPASAPDPAARVVLELGASRRAEAPPATKPETANPGTTNPGATKAPGPVVTLNPFERANRDRNRVPPSEPPRGEGSVPP